MYYFKNGLYVPAKSKPIPNVLVFIDESYFDSNSGFIQSAFVITKDLYTNYFIPESTKVLSKLGRNAKEFKASNISKGNLKIYKDFLSIIETCIVTMADHSPLHSFVSIDSNQVYEEINLSDFVNTISSAFASISVILDSHLIYETTRQLYWLFNHYGNICNTKLSNEFEFIFDQKHRYAKECHAKGFIFDKFGRGIFVPKKNAIKHVSNAAFQTHFSTRPYPRIHDFKFYWSTKEIGLQASDLISNLVFNTLKVMLGSTNNIAKLKHDLLLDVVPSLRLYDDLNKALTLTYASSNYEGIANSNSKLLSTINFL
jgi:hypothetical protein